MKVVLGPTSVRLEPLANEPAAVVDAAERWLLSVGYNPTRRRGALVIKTMSLADTGDAWVKISHGVHDSHLAPFTVHTVVFTHHGPDQDDDRGAASPAERSRPRAPVPVGAVSFL